MATITMPPMTHQITGFPVLLSCPASVEALLTSLPAASNSARPAAEETAALVSGWEERLLSEGEGEGEGLAEGAAEDSGWLEDEEDWLELLLWLLEELWLSLEEAAEDCALGSS